MINFYHLCSQRTIRAQSRHVSQTPYAVHEHVEVCVLAALVLICHQIPSNNWCCRTILKWIPSHYHSKNTYSNPRTIRERFTDAARHLQIILPYVFHTSIQTFANNFKQNMPGQSPTNAQPMRNMQKWEYNIKMNFVHMTYHVRASSALVVQTPHGGRRAHNAYDID